MWHSSTGKKWISVFVPVRSVFANTVTYIYSTKKQCINFQPTECNVKVSMNYQSSILLRFSHLNQMLFIKYIVCIGMYAAYPLQYLYVCEYTTTVICSFLFY